MGAKLALAYLSLFYSSSLSVSITLTNPSVTSLVSALVVKRISCDYFAVIVSFLVAYMVAYLRKYRYRKFQRRRRTAGDRTEGPAVGITGNLWD